MVPPYKLSSDRRSHAVRLMGSVTRGAGKGSSGEAINRMASSHVSRMLVFPAGVLRLNPIPTPSFVVQVQEEARDRDDVDGPNEASQRTKYARAPYSGGHHAQHDPNRSRNIDPQQSR